VAGELLLDTGPLVSILDRRQDQHEECVRFFESWTGKTVASEAILTEATHLLGGVAGGRRACVDFFLAGAAALVPPSRRSLKRCAELIAKYDDVPMDYADSTLVVLAEELGTDLVFTLDRRGFAVYRFSGRRSFRIVPS
jgi:hypothetical protein